MRAALIGLSLAMLGATSGTEISNQSVELRGRVTAYYGGEALPAASIEVTPAAPWEPRVTFRAVTDPTGSFRFTDVPPGFYRVASRLLGFYDTAAYVELEGEPVVVALANEVTATVECLVGTRESSWGSIRVRDAGLSFGAALVFGEARFPVHPNGEFGSEDCQTWVPRAADEARVELIGVGSHVVKRRGVRPEAMPWRLVVDMPSGFAVRLARRYSPQMKNLDIRSGEVPIGVMTTLGEFVMAVDPAREPIAAANFLRTVGARAFDGGIFHRSLKEGIQGRVNAARIKEAPATSDFFVPLDEQRSKRSDSVGRVVTGLDVVHRISQEPQEGQALSPPVTIIGIRRVAR
jgi:peptidyl-prolyl cis-trans isomerase A (cyclophilin A)